MSETKLEATMADLEPLARELYEASRKRVSGRPPWERLNPNDPYDMGMRGTAFLKARQQREAERATTPEPSP